ncbi:MAG: patatin-like phospholipase family protein [Burkholderiaceae bacterium]
MVIGSGGLRCVSAFGVLQVLQREGIAIDLVVACSGGALAGYWIASGRDDPAEGIAEFIDGWLGAFDRLAYRKILGAVFPRLLGFDARFGVMSDRAINAALAGYVADTRFDDLDMPLHFVATDVHSGEKVVLADGPVFDAMRATIAIPLVIPPWAVDGRLLMDGALCDPMPVDVAIREGADIILAVGFEESLQTEIGSGIDLSKQVIAVATNHLLRAQFAFQSMVHHAEVIAILPDFGRPVGLRDTHLISHLVARGAAAAEAEMPYLRRLIEHAAEVRA